MKFIDINCIPAVTYPVLDELRNMKPDLLMRKYAINAADPKDTGLRVPLRVAEKKKKKKGKKRKKR